LKFINQIVNESMGSYKFISDFHSLNDSVMPGIILQNMIKVEIVILLFITTNKIELYYVL